ncbi:MFS transporter [Nesterenkonia xinjiangensis]|uniref:Fucose permease n=2 Tax=Nesterenkonia xinjiangensis TaxID=225327 RepID=A0A7Z0GPB0_9MICC|nr:MFS transporter [Nesterenkonia xinjiangensis]NYJ79680.1 fucose permease [Nesterenkonia xinjiangensis]
MQMPTSPRGDQHGPVSVRLRRSRLATMTAFATNGALPASLLARYAEVKETLGLSPALFGLLVVGFGLGGTLAVHLPGVVSRTVGVARAAGFGTLWVGASLVLATVGIALGDPWLVVAGLLLAGFGDATVDVAQNSQGLRVQEAYGRSLLNSMHAGWSIGAALGGGVGTLAALAGIPLLGHMAVWAMVCVLAMSLSARAFLPEPRRVLGTAQSTTRPTGWATAKILVPLALVALAGISVEDVGNNWSAVLLSSERDMAAASAGVGLTVLLTAQFIGRMLGDRVIDRLGDRRSLLLSLAAVILGLLAAAWAPTIALTLAGLALAGLGCAVTVPIAFARADAVPGLPPHSGVTWISWTMRTVTLSLSPTIGALSQGTSLPIALTAVTLIAVLALALQLRTRGAEPRGGPAGP